VFKKLDDSGKGNGDLHSTEFPFIATCLAIGASYHEKHHYSHAVGALKRNDDLSSVDNNDSICHFDVTNPCNVRYAMMMGHEQADEAYEFLPLETLMDARTYTSTY